MPRDLHDTARWKHPVNGVSALVRKYNPLCQWVNPATGKQCTQPSQVVHHLIDPKINPDVFFSWNNLVAVCKDHHSGGQVGDTQNYSYCHTIGPRDTIYVQNAGLLPCWHRDHRPVSESLLPPGSTCSAVGDDVLTRALQSVL